MRKGSGTPHQEEGGWAPLQARSDWRDVRPAEGRALSRGARTVAWRSSSLRAPELPAEAEAKAAPMGLPDAQPLLVGGRPADR